MLSFSIEMYQHRSCHRLNYTTLHVIDTWHHDMCCISVVVLVDTNMWYHSTYIHPGEVSITIGSEYD